MIIKRLVILLLLFALLIPALAAADAEHPAWTGSPYIIYNNNVPFFEGVSISREFVQYSPRDELGRVGPAMAYIGPVHFQAERESIQSYTPTGFSGAKYDFIPGSLYHRCHLIAHRLTNSGDYYENLFTGTQYLNLGIMSQIESMIADYISRTENHVLYQVSPDFIGDELVCRGVIIEAESIEDAEIKLCYYCFNVQPGVVIDYATGESRLAQYAAVPVPEEQETDELLPIGDDIEEPETRPTEVMAYVLNTNRKRFHLPGCKSVQDIKPKNRRDFIGTRDELIDMGYKPCGECNP